MPTVQEKIRDQVRKRYTLAVTSRNTGCCGSGCCGGSAEPEEDRTPGCGGVTAMAGYDREALKTLPADAVEHSFGCGDPLAFAGVMTGQTVVDIGSGAGIDCLLAARQVGPEGRVIGIDMTPVMIEKARENAAQAGAANVEFRLGEAESMPVDDGTADWIISNCVINLSPDKPRVFREAFRVLRTGGRLSISDIMVEKLPWFLRRSPVLYTACVAGAIPESRYLKGLREAGFTDVRVTGRIVYDRSQIVGLLGEVRWFGPLTRILKRPATFLVDRYIVGKVWSAKVTARKEDTTSRHARESGHPELFETPGFPLSRE